MNRSALRLGPGSDTGTRPGSRSDIAHGTRVFLPRETGVLNKRTKVEQAAEPTQPTKAAKAKPAPQPGRWLDRDCSAALNMQCIGESRWRQLELCYWPEQGKLPAKGKEFSGLGYKRVRDKPPKAEQLQQSAGAQ
ncbi:hypothetical protein QJQ45_001865 [Haematococcus lacustris]|nr:hypothetical protein QJQ45_001865 [Haematococcus lacustris]